LCLPEALRQRVLKTRDLSPENAVYAAVVTVELRVTARKSERHNRTQQSWRAGHFHQPIIADLRGDGPDDARAPRVSSGTGRFIFIRDRNNSRFQRRGVIVRNIGGEREDQTRERVSIVTDLIRCRRPLWEIRLLLGNLSWDSDPLVSVSKDDVSTVLQSFIEGVVTASFVGEWAEMLESRDDVYFADFRIERAVFTLANPALEGELSVELARNLLAALRH